MDPLTTPRLLQQAAQPVEESKKLLRRIGCELDFARAFAELAGNSDWPALIEQATALIDNCDGDVAGAVTAAETLLTPIGKAAKNYTIHCVGHGHIDMNWMWSWQETVATTHDTFASVLQLMKEYPTLTYSQSQASVYALTEKYHPEMFAEIQQRVKEGRWEVTAAHWVEGEKNLASGESIARHLLYTRRYTQEKFGLGADDLPLDWEPDTFGHANTIPTILAKGGVKFYYACRLGGGFDHAVTGDFPRPRLFWWEGPDGSRILVNKESTWYNSYVNIGDNIALPAVEFFQETKLTDWMNVFGIGNHGGGPTRKEVDYLLETATWPIYPTVQFGTAKGWYETVAGGDLSHLPVLNQELNYEFTGCYTTQTLIKQANRFGENYCIDAETLAAVTDRDARPLLREAWLNVLFNQFHDILPGSGVRQTREHAMAIFQETGAITGAIKREAGKAIAASVNTAALATDLPTLGEFGSGMGAGIGAMESGISKAGGGGSVRPYVIWNPCAWERTEPVIIRLYDTGFEPGRIVARDEDGKTHPTFILFTGEDWGHKYIEVLFFATVPALGYKTYALCEGKPTVDVPRVKAMPRDGFETPFGTVHFDRFAGGFGFNLGDSSGRDSAPGLGSWSLTQEQPRGMTAWVLGGELPGEQRDISVRSHHVHGVHRNRGTAYPSGESLAYVVQQHLPVPQTKSSIRLSALIHGFAPRIDVTAEVDWREVGDAERGIPGLQVHFPLEYADAPLRYETPFGSVLRNDIWRQEVPSLRYVHASGDGEHLTILNDCKYGFNFELGTISMRIIRSSFDPDPIPEVCKHQVKYSVYFHQGEVGTGELTRLGAAFNQPFIAFPAAVQSAEGPLSKSFASVENSGVVLTSLKKAESGAGVVLRLVEYDGKDTEAVVTLGKDFGGRAQLTDLLESDGGESLSFDGKTLRVPVKANSIASVRVF